MKRVDFHQNIPSWLLITAAVFVSLITLLVIAGLVLAETHRKKILPGISVGSLSLSNENPDKAREKINNLVDKLEQGIAIKFENKKVLIPQPLNSLSPDLAQQTVIFDVDETLRQAWSIGHEGSWLKISSDYLRAVLLGRKIKLVANVDQVVVKSILEKEFAEFNKAYQNAGVEFIDDKPSIKPEQAGLSLDYDTAINKLAKQFSEGIDTEIVLESRIEKPIISREEATGLLGEIDSFLNFSKTELVFEKKSWSLDLKIAKQWLGFAREKNKVVLALDTNLIKEYLTKEVSPKIDKEPMEARLSMEASRVSVWQAGQDGLKVDLDETARRIAAWPKDNPQKIEIATAIIAGGAADATAEELGLKEIIGTGVSQFSGSPANRRHNIRTGANALHGLLIKPGEEFSLLKALGEIDAKSGYLPELVIKENKTIPEYGGGLCQIGTTMFRATFNSGLPVTQRRNHSYRVVYYEPAGTDATIYDPAPDYRFVNDTGHHILIQARMSGDNLAFDFWGTKDGRNVEYTKPVIYNIVSPGPTKIIETPDLPEGQKKCTEKAHNGADAYFDYKVSYSNGEVKQQRFSSHYVPWQAVCLVGAKKSPDGGIPGSPSNTITPSITPAASPLAQ